jgi:hypothetical protein
LMSLCPTKPSYQTFHCKTVLMKNWTFPIVINDLPIDQTLLSAHTSILSDAQWWL